MPYLASWERSARKEGKKEGANEEKTKTAKRMLDDNLSIEMISKYTGLSAKEIEKLKPSPKSH